MKLIIEAENRNPDAEAGPIPFGFMWRVRTSTVDPSTMQAATVKIKQHETPNSYGRGEKVRLEIDFPYTSFTPGDLIWKPLPGLGGKWCLTYGATDDGKPLLTNVPPAPGAVVGEDLYFF